MKHIRIILCLTLLLAAASAAARVKYTVNDAWRFTKGSPYNAFLPAADDSAWEVVNIPHTWNAEDAVDDVPGFYRGPAWYRKRIVLPADAADKQVYLCFEGANQVVRLYVNGHYAGKHTGGYTRFVFDITKYIVPGGENLFAAEVDNAHDPDIPPLSADFTFFGGIYRDVSLLMTDKVHVAPTDFASPGVYLSTPEVTAERARCGRWWPTTVRKPPGCASSTASSRPTGARPHARKTPRKSPPEASRNSSAGASRSRRPGCGTSTNRTSTAC